MLLPAFITSIRGWTNYKDPDVHPDSLVTSWVRMGEEIINSALRVADMVTMGEVTIADSKANTPDDWLANDFVADKETGREYDYQTVADFYKEAKPSFHYTTVGKVLVFGGAADDVEGDDIDLHYFARIPQMGNAENWMSLNNITLLTSATMVFASAYMREWDASAGYRQSTMDLINTLNAEYTFGKLPRDGTIKRKVPRRI